MVLRWIYHRYWDNHCFYCNGLGNLHNIRHGAMTHAELTVLYLRFFFLFFDFLPIS